MTEPADPDGGASIAPEIVHGVTPKPAVEAPPPFATPAAAPSHNPKGISPAEAFAEALGTALINIDLYGLQHRIALNSMETSFRKLADALANAKRIDFAASEDEVLCLNGAPCKKGNSKILALTRRLKAVHISSFAMRQGMDADEYVKIITYLAKPRTASEDGLTDIALPHMMVTRTVVMHVAEGEESPGQGGGGGTGGGEQVDPQATQKVEQILAFLKGDVSLSESQAQAGIAEAANDADKLADLILEATAVRQAAQNLGAGESLGDLVVGCLRRTFSALNKDPCARTQKGKNELKKTLAVLEQSVLEKLRKHSAEGYESAAPLVNEEIASMQEEMHVGGLVAQYVKSRRAVDEKEKKLLRFMKKNPGEEQAAGLREEMEAAGLGEDGWQELVVKSGMAKSEGSGGAPQAPADTTLIMLLAELTRAVDQASSEDQVAAALKKVESGIESSTQRTSEKIDDLAAARDKKPLRDPSSRRSFMKLLREIVQELCQPVTVIGTTVDMLAAGRLGKLPPTQYRMLQLASEEGKRVQFLIDKLIGVLGVPSYLSPDTNDLEGIYGPPPSP